MMEALSPAGLLPDGVDCHDMDDDEIIGIFARSHLPIPTMGRADLLLRSREMNDQEPEEKAEFQDNEVEEEDPRMKGTKRLQSNVMKTSKKVKRHKSDPGPSTVGA